MYDGWWFLNWRYSNWWCHVRDAFGLLWHDTTPHASKAVWHVGRVLLILGLVTCVIGVVLLRSPVEPEPSVEMGVPVHRFDTDLQQELHGRLIALGGFALIGLGTFLLIARTWQQPVPGDYDSEHTSK